MRRYPIEIKNIYNVSAIEDKKIIADLLRDVTYRFSGHGRKGYRGFYDYVLTNRFGFTLYADTKEIREIYLSSLSKFMIGFPEVTIRMRNSRLDRDQADFYKIKSRKKA